MWINGRADGIAWTDVVTSNGIAHGARSRMEVAEQRVEQGNLEDPEAGPLGDYDDPSAVLAGSWGPNQHGTGTVFARNPTGEFFQEVEIRLRTVIEPNRCTGYEVFWRCLKADEGLRGDRALERTDRRLHHARAAGRGILRHQARRCG